MSTKKTVSDLINELSQFPGDMEVFIDDLVKGCCVAPVIRVAPGSVGLPPAVQILFPSEANDDIDIMVMEGKLRNMGNEIDE